MELSVIYVNWNSLDYLRESIVSVYEHTRGLTFEIVVVDNASTEPGIETLAHEFPAVILVKSDRNLGCLPLLHPSLKEVREGPDGRRCPAGDTLGICLPSHRQDLRE